ncbi:MAG: M14 family metallopeptidase [Chthoniobacterales bacterium]|nr:M14 family metallopeptidase [Chthoniobacterales bacterium]
MRRSRKLAALLVGVCSIISSSAALAVEAILPPLVPWDGKSRELIAPKDDPWITHAEEQEFRTTPSYDETVEWLRKLVKAAPELQLVSLGKSSDGRDIWMVIASRDQHFLAEALRKSDKPTVLAQGGIHSGEIDGKDAGMMLLRDMTVGGRKRELLEGANFLFVPIFNVDGHERTSRFSRVNQRGPEVMGWRTTSRNLNLNRDYAKADAPEMAAMLRALNEWQPDLYLDLHVTDGADYQYDITFGSNGAIGHSPSIATWLEKNFTPAVTNDLAAMGHIPGPVDAPNWIDPRDWKKGIKTWMADPRFSNGYGDVRHLPTVLVENHSLKPYQQRVLGTYVLLESALRVVAKTGPALREAIESDRRRRPATVPLAWDVDPKKPDETMEYKAIETRVVPSEITGEMRVEYNGKPVSAKVPYQKQNRVSSGIARPKAYWIPAAWPEIIERLQLHGIALERIEEARELPVTMYRLQEAKFESEAFEGRVRVNAKPVPEKRTERFASGSVRVTTDQPLGNLAAVLLEPASADSFFQWGFFSSVLQETEYIESYVIEPMAERMMKENPKLAEEFRARLEKDEAFRSSAKERLRWFYSRTAFGDERWKLYPVAREE